MSDIFDMMDEMDRRMRRLMDRIFADAYSDLYDMERRELRPLTNITETDDEVIVSIDLPCARKDNIELKATSDTLYIKAKMDRCVRISNVDFEHYSRSIRLPSRVDASNARASFKGGVLQVRLPKKIEGSGINIE